MSREAILFKMSVAVKFRIAIVRFKIEEALNRPQAMNIMITVNSKIQCMNKSMN